jgi:hypothetical protein
MKSIIKISASILLLLLVNYAVPANAATTYHLGGAKKTLLPNTVTVEAGYYDATTLSAEDTDLAAGNIKKPVNIFGIVGTYEGAGGTSYGLPKTGQQPGLPDGTPFLAGDDCSYASPEVSPGDVGYPRGKLTWTAYNAARFTDNGDGTITDNATGLEWIKDPIASPGGAFTSTMTWANAITSCEALIYPTGGHEDWRLPNILELLSIVDWGRSSPAANPTFFPNIPSSPMATDSYWSSTTVAGMSDYAWSVVFSAGSGGAGSPTRVGKTYHDSSNSFVRPVRGGQ